MNHYQPQRAGKQYSTRYLARRKFRERLAEIGLWAVMIGIIIMAAAWGNPDDPLADVFYDVGLRLSVSSLFFFSLITVPLTDRPIPRWRDFIQNKISIFSIGIGWLLMNSVSFSAFGWWDPPTWWQRLASFCLLVGYLLLRVDVESNDGDSCRS